mgnify:CR=1 FL=1
MAKELQIKDIPSEDRPYEKCLARGAAALSDAELLAVILRSGAAGQGDFTFFPVRQRAFGASPSFRPGTDEDPRDRKGESRAAEMHHGTVHTDRNDAREGVAVLYRSVFHRGILYGASAP